MPDSSESLAGAWNSPATIDVPILLVDDNPANLLSLQSLLGAEHPHLVEARSGEEALQLVQATEFAVILLDVLMPGLSGFETARRIREHSRSRHTPIIFLTAGDIDAAQLEEGYLLGAVDFLSKPVLPVVLKAKVRGFVELFAEKHRSRHETELLRLLVQGTTEYAIFLLDPQGHVVTWNPGAERLQGYAAKEIISQHFSRFYPQEAIDRGWPDYELEIATAVGRFEDEGWRVRKDGTQFWANVVITALKDDAGDLRGFSKITRDMTERKKSEENTRRLVEEENARKTAEALARTTRDQREQLHVTLQSIGDGVISLDADGRVSFLNRVAQTLTGWAAEDAVGQTLADVFQRLNEQTREVIVNPALRVLQGGMSAELTNHTLLLDRDGGERLIDFSAAPIRSERGTILGAVLVFRDMTERRDAEDQLRRSEQRFSRFMQHLPGLAWIKDTDGRYVYANQAAQRAFQRSGDDLYGKTDEELFPRETADLFRQNDAQAIVSGAGVHVVEELQHVDGQTHYSLVSKFPIANADGTVSLVGGMAIDITEQRRIEQALRESERLYRAIGESIDYGVWICDADGRNVYASPSFLRLVGLTQEQCSEFGWGDVLHPDDAERTIAAWKECARTGGQWDIEHRFKGVDGQWHPVLARGVPVRNEQGEITGWAGINLDISRLKQVEEKLRDADRRKDEFLATLAHELRNPLAPIRNSLQILKMPRVDAATVQQTRDIMERQVQHLVRLVDDLLDVSRVMRGKIELRKERVELASVVARAVETAKPLIEVQGHTLDIAVPAESLLLDADPVRLTQVFGNLLTNAAKYTEANGRIWLSARRDGGHAVLSIRDTGIGIAPDMLPHVFELFVQADHTSTRAQGGLGIGLTLVKNLVEMHGGTVEARSSGLGGGSEFVVTLPLVVPVSTPANGSDRDGFRAPPATSGYRLLVVDDNRDAALSLAVLLRLQGHDVQVAHDGPTALQVAMRFQPDLMFLDLGMPRMDGYEVARRIRSTPELSRIKLAALTGWGQQEDRRRTAEAGFDHHLVKPPEPKLVEALLAELKQTSPRLS
jgi:PAS domain S-box-containing protein